MSASTSVTITQRPPTTRPTQSNSQTLEFSEHHAIMQNNDSDTQNRTALAFRKGEDETDSQQTSADAAPLHDLTAFQRDLLRVIAAHGGDPGQRIKETLERFYDGVEGIQPGRLYPNLDTLVDKGLVQKESADRRTNAYSLTPRGRRELALHRNWWLTALDTVDDDGESNSESDAESGGNAR